MIQKNNRFIAASTKDYFILSGVFKKPKPWENPYSWIIRGYYNRLTRFRFYLLF